MSRDEIISKTKEMMALMTTAEILGKKPGLWMPVAKPNPSTMVFADHEPVENFTGTMFRLYGENGSQTDYFEPPSDLGLEHDNSHGENNGFWKRFVPKEIKAVRTLVETGISAPKSSSQLRGWSSRQIAKYLLGEAENYESLYACIIAQLEKIPTSEAQTAIEQLTALMETTVERTPKTGKVGKVLKTEEGEEGLEQLATGMEGLSIKKSPKKRSPSPKPKSPPKPKPKSPPKAAAAGSEKMDKLMAKYRQRVKEKGDTSTMADAIKRLAGDLGYNDEYMEENYDFYGFGRTRLKPNRRKSRRTSKRMRTLMRRTSGVKKRVKRSSGKSLKRKKQRMSRRKSGEGRKVKLTKFKKSFGSSIYGLQGGLQSGPIYSGVYPMTLKVNESLPNLNNVTRSYALNEFGKPRRNKKRSRSPKKDNGCKIDRRGRKGSRSPKEMTRVLEMEGRGNEFGCGLYGCGSCGSRSFGCGCGGGKEENENENENENI